MQNRLVKPRLARNKTKIYGMLIAGNKVFSILTAFRDHASIKPNREFTMAKKKTAAKKTTKKKTAMRKTTKKKSSKKRPGLYANIHKAQERAKHGGRPVRKKGEKGAPTAKQFKNSAKTAKKR